MKRIVCAAAVIFMIFGLFAFPTNALEQPTVEHVKSAYLYNFENDVVIFKYNEHETVFPAASVKLMTGIVAYGALSERLDEKVTVTASMLNEVKGNNISLKIGEVVSVRDMMYALLTNCANDAAYVLAYTAYGSPQAFVSKMNQRAKEFGAFDTNYTNPTGMHDDKMVTTAYDTAIIARHLYDDPVLMEMVSSKNYVMEATNLTQYRNIYSRNALLYTQPGSEKSYRYASATGMNAGYTTQGGYCITATAGDDSLNYLCIVMGAEEIDGEIYSYKTAAELFDWAFKSYKYAAVLSTDTTVVELPVRLSSTVDYVTLVPETGVSVFLPTDIDFDTEITYSINTFDDYLNAPVEMGKECGFVTVTYNDDIIATARLIATADVARSEFLYTMAKIEEFSHSIFFISAVITAVVLTAVYIIFQATRTDVSRRRNAVRTFMRKNK